MLRRLTARLCRSREQTISTWWSVTATDGERYMVHATEWQIGRFRSVDPSEAFIHYESVGSTPDSMAQEIENMSGREFASLIANGTAIRLVS